MILTGNQIVNADPSTLWKILMDPVSLAEVVPGISNLEKLSDDCFYATLSLKIGPLNGTFTGNLQLEDIYVEKSFALRTLQQSKMGNANADVQINLVPLDHNHTDVIFDGNIKLSGMLASIGQRLVGGVADSLTQQFFVNLQNELEVTTSFK